MASAGAKNKKGEKIQKWIHQKQGKGYPAQ